MGGLDVEIHNHLVSGVVGDRIRSALSKTWTGVSYLTVSDPPSGKQLTFDNSHTINLLAC